ncbi:MAG: hypothetical protein U5L72_10220 [Bacteroidales bacterium]|nr:hypothetical protein [Bacteroidales bacterium]
MITQVKNGSGSVAEVRLETAVYDADNRRVASSNTDPLTVNGSVTAVTQELRAQRSLAMVS